MKYSKFNFIVSYWVVFFACANFFGYAQQTHYTINRVNSQFSIAYFLGFWDYQHGYNTISSKDVVNYFQDNHRWLAADFKKANDKYMIGRVAFIGGGALVVSGLIAVGIHPHTPGAVLLCIGAASIGFSIPFLLLGEKERKKTLYYYNKHFATTDVNRLYLKLSMSNVSINYNF
jgi:hypothetical protein